MEKYTLLLNIITILIGVCGVLIVMNIKELLWWIFVAIEIIGVRNVIREM